jgi:hypothetical protein
MAKNNQYFASLPPEETASELLHRAKGWMSALQMNGYLEKLEMSQAAYHGSGQGNFNEGHRLQFTGEQGELVTLPVNHYRNIAEHIITMITASRPKMQARSINTDAKSLVQATLANGILDYYLREKRLESYLTLAVKYAIVLGSGYVKMDWDATAGEVIDYNDDGTPEYMGDLTFTNLSPYDVYFDTTKETNQQHDWYVTRTFKNKYDLAAKYPEKAEMILKLETKADIMRYRMDAYFKDETDDIPVYELYHRKTNSMPDGRYLLFLTEDLALLDSPMPYRELPVFRITPGEVLGTPLGYTPMFDLLPLQDSINVLYSMIFTNNHTFGVQNILSPRGADVDYTSIAGGLNFMEYNAPAGKPEALQLTQSSPEAYKLIEMLVRDMETISGVNSVARGNPDQNLKSGAALALVQGMALQYINGFQQSYIRLVEDCGTGILNMLKDFAAEPRVATIVGVQNRTYLKQFTGDDLLSVGRVIVDVGNPLSSTHAGKLQIADQLLQYQLLKDPKQYLTLVETGSLELLIEDENKSAYLLKDENEAMLNGEPVMAMVTDDHLRHINSHKSVLDDVRLRRDMDLVGRVTAHMQEHIDLLRSTDPQFLQTMGQQPLPPQGGTSPGPQNFDPNQQVNNSAGNDVDQMQALSEPPQNALDAANIQQPQPAQAPPVNDPRQLQAPQGQQPQGQ